jgi:hypothetical protein
MDARVTFHLPQSWLDVIESRAAQRSLPLSTIIREIVAKGLRGENLPPARPYRRNQQPINANRKRAAAG